MAEFILRLDDPTEVERTLDSLEESGVDVKHNLAQKYVVVDAESAPEIAGVHVLADDDVASAVAADSIEDAELLLSAHRLRNNPEYQRAKKDRPMDGLDWDAGEPQVELSEPEGDVS